MRHQILSGTAILWLGQFLSQACGFARNIILARLLGPEHFGVAATLLITLSAFEMTSELGLDRYLVQSTERGAPSVQRTAQLLQLLRAGIVACALLLLGAPLATWFGAPEASWSFQLLALVPLARGLVHLDVFRQQRELRFERVAAAETFSQVAMTAAAYPLARMLGDFTAMLWLLLGQAALYAAATHMAAQRAYGWAWDRAVAHRLLSFSWPLTLNGVLMFLVMQGDRVVVSRAFGMEDLGRYSVAFALAIAPTTMLLKVLGSMMLPLLSATAADHASFARRLLLCAQLVSLISAVVAVPLILLGEPLAVWIYGREYLAAGEIVGWLAAAQCVRMLRGTPTVAAMALGDTRNSLWSNVWRASAWLGVVGAAMGGAALAGIASVALAGEVLAFVAAVVRLRRVHGVGAGVCLWPAVFPAVGFALAASCVMLGMERAGSALVASAAILTFVLSAAWICFPELRREGRGLWERLRLAGA